MKINPQSFFNFCANHAPLLRALAERGGELSETETMRDDKFVGELGRGKFLQRQPGHF